MEWQYLDDSFNEGAAEIGAALAARSPRWAAPPARSRRGEREKRRGGVESR